MRWKVRTFKTDWTYEEIFAEAKRFNSIKEWKTNHQASYIAAGKISKVRSIAEELGWKTQRSTPWTFDELLQEASNFNSLSAWNKGHPASYKFAQEKRIQRDVAKALGWNIKKAWTDEEIFQEAKKFTSLNEWQKKHRNSYQAARARGLLKEVTNKLNWKSKTIQSKNWTFEDYFNEARKFLSASDWNKAQPYIYKTAPRGVKTRIAEELGWPIRGEKKKPNKKRKRA